MTKSKSSTSEAQTKSNRKTLIALALLFSLPVVLAFMMYASGKYPTGQLVNHGRLVKPVASLKPFFNNYPTGKWALMFVGDERCLDQCLRATDQIGRARLALGKKGWRVKQFLILPKQFQSSSQFISSLPAATFLALKAGDYQALANLLATSNEKAFLALADPAGNIVLTYQANTKAKALYEDLQRLLKYSSQG